MLCKHGSCYMLSGPFKRSGLAEKEVKKMKKMQGESIA